MFERKLLALEFYSPQDFDYQDEKVFRNFIIWLENQKIRMYTVEDRAELDKIEGENWPKAFEKYLDDLQLNNLTIQNDRESMIEQLLAHAVRLEYSDNIDKYNTLNAQEFSHHQDSSQNVHPLESLDYNCQEFKEGIHRLQRLLDIPTKEDDVTSVLQAISKLIYDKLRAEVIQENLKNLNTVPLNKNNNSNNSIQISLESVNLGFDTNDKILNEAAKVLRLLHIHELRDLQTRINETIVAIQAITANPKTDASLGKVGH